MCIAMHRIRQHSSAQIHCEDTTGGDRGLQGLGCGVGNGSFIRADCVAQEGGEHHAGVQRMSVGRATL